MPRNKSAMKDFLILHLVLLIYSGTSVVSKLASGQSGMKFLVFYGISLLCLAVYAVLWQSVLKKFPLTIAFANKAIVVVWGIIWGAVFFGEKITLNKLIGAIVIITGIIVVVSEHE